MYALADIKGVKQNTVGTDLIIRVPDLQLQQYIMDKKIWQTELRLDDGRLISAAQRKKAYATIRDISDFTGYPPEDQKEWLKYLHIIHTGCDDFSLSDCSMDTAREFINTMMDYVIEQGIPLSERGIERTDDIGKYLFFCLKHKKCAVCGRDGEIHHVDTIGMGNDRRTLDDTNHRKICLCREHHTIAHQRGMDAFQKMYKVYGILYDDRAQCDDGWYMT